MADRHVQIGRSWPLTDAMVAAARHRGCTVALTEGEPVLVVDGRSWVLPDPTECARVRTSLVLGLVAHSLSPAPSRATATIIAPAAGHCGPSAVGPVDAIRDEGGTDGCTIGSRSIPWSARTLSVQQSRCWLVCATFDCEPVGCDSSRSTLPVLPAAVALDSARATQYQLDRGAGAHWPDVLLLGAPDTHDGRVSVRVMHTDGVLTAYIIERALAGAETLVSR